MRHFLLFLVLAGAMQPVFAQQVICERRLGSFIVGGGTFNTYPLGLLVTPTDSVVLALDIQPPFISSLPTRRFALLRFGRTRCETAYLATAGQGADWGSAATELPLIATRRGRLLALAYQQNSVLADSGRMHLQSCSPGGQLRWDKVYRPRQQSEDGAGLLEAPDYGTYVVSRASVSGVGSHGRLTKVDSLGRVQWQRIYGSRNSREQFNFTRPPAYTARGSLLLSGEVTRTLPNGTGTICIQVVEVGQHGDSITSRQFLRLPGTQPYLASVRPLRDGGFLLSGLLDSITTNLIEYPFWVRLDANLNPVWTYIRRSAPTAQVYGFKAGFELADGTLLAVYNGTTAVHFLRLSAAGAVLNSFSFAPQSTPSSPLYPQFLEPVARDSSFVVLAQQRGTYLGRFRLLGLRRVLPLPPIPAAAPLGTRADGRAGVVLGVAYPNPADDAARVNYVLPITTASAVLTLTDVLGRVVQRQTLAAGSTHTTMPVRELAAGLYQVRLLIDGRLHAIQKLAVVH